MATMDDVARRAGVTKQTVSNVINGKIAVRKQTRERVLVAIQELGYRPNLVARGLRQGKTSVLAVLVPRIMSAFYAEMVEEIERVAGEHQYSLLLGTTQSDLKRLRHQVNILFDRSIDGLLLAQDHYIAQELSTIALMNFPVVLCGWETEPFPDMFPVVSIDFRHAGYLAGQHLLELGHQSRIAVIFEASAHESRLQGFCAALQAGGVELPPELRMATAHSIYEDGYQAAKILLARSPLPRAIFATSDTMAVATIEAAREVGLRVPEDISIIGMDSIVEGVHSYPSLTTVALPVQEMAREMTRLLLRSITEETVPAHLLTLLRPHLVVRHSTARPSEG
jgi:LacI family transcriptional regulator